MTSDAPRGASILSSVHRSAFAARSLAASFVAVLFSSCASPPGRLTFEVDSRAPPDIVNACRLADHRCSRCHPIERIINGRVSSFEQWQAVVHRMSLQLGSAIAVEEEPALVRCLTYVTLGPNALPRTSESESQRSAP